MILLCDDIISCKQTIKIEGKMPSVSNHKKRSITIVEERNDIFDILHLDDMTDEEVDSIWYDPEEYKEIKVSYQSTVMMMESGEPLPEEEHTSRGLEYRTQEGAWARHENKRDACNAVLDEQDRQWQDEADDHNMISRIYIEHSQRCAEAAAERGKSDEQEAEILSSIAYMSTLQNGIKDPGTKRSTAKIVEVRETLRENASTRRSEVLDDLKRLEKEQRAKFRDERRVSL
jgi:hypothetical protein